MTQLEKIAKLMGWECESVTDTGVWVIEHEKPLNRDNEHPIRLFNPLTSKLDLIDVECALRIDVEWSPTDLVVLAYYKKMFFPGTNGYVYAAERISDHPDIFTARAHVVCSVAEQIYDITNGISPKLHPDVFYELVGEVVIDPMLAPALKVPVIEWKNPIVELEVGTKLYRRK